MVIGVQKKPNDEAGHLHCCTTPGALGALALAGVLRTENLYRKLKVGGEAFGSVYVAMYLCMCTCRYRCMHAYAYIYICTHTYTHTYIHTYICMHVCIHAGR